MKQFYFFLLILMMIASTSKACTIFSAQMGNSVVLVGNNEDWFGSQGKIWIFPPEDSLLGIIAWGIGDSSYEGAMNEKGLFYDANAVLDGKQVIIHPEKEEFDFNHLYYIMTHFSAIEEVENYLKNYNLSLLNEGQMRFADAFGNSMIVEGDSNIISEKYYQISTNFYHSDVPNPLEEPEKYSRYFIADSMLSANPNNITIDLFKEICKNTSSPNYELNGTAYSNVCDLVNKKIYFYHMRDYEHPIEIDLFEEFEKGNHESYLYDLYITEYPSGNKYAGIWESEGYGYLLFIDEMILTTITSETPCSYVQLYERTSVSMLYDNSLVIIDGSVYVLDSDGELIASYGTLERTSAVSAVLYSPCGTEIRFKPFEVDGLDDVDRIANGINSGTDNPNEVFDVFWHTLEENFAFFDIMNIDWKNLYDEKTKVINSSTTEEDLFTIMAESFSLLNDGHGSLIGTINGKTYSHYMREPNPSQWMAENITSFFSIIDKKMKNGLKCEVEDRMYYGITNDSILYINILAYLGYSESGSIPDEKINFSKSIDKILFDDENYKGIMIDIRWNIGGYDECALSLAGRFTNQTIHAYSKQARIGDYNEFSQLTPIYVEPAEKRVLNKPVRILTSRLTVSGGDIQALILKNAEFSNVKLIGENTNGSLSNMFERTLPNGWSLNLSNERYVDINGNHFEYEGITPHIIVPPSKDSLDNQVDNIFNYAANDICSHETSIFDSQENLYKHKCWIQNFPNPFSEQTTFSFQLEKTANVQLIIYNILGEKIVVLADNTFNKGQHSLKFQKNHLSAGIYFYVFKTDNIKITKKMLMIP